MSRKSFTEYLNKEVSFDMIFVEGGTFIMGSEDAEAWDREKPVHKVKLSGFYIARYPVTQALWKAIMEGVNNPSYFKGDSRPVETVSWKDAQDFIKALNYKKNRNYRLPTEAEWEYAAQGGRNSKGYIYAGSNYLKEVGFYDANSYGETKDVGLKEPNELGLCDMSGNIWEWCSDKYSDSYYQECLNKGIVLNPIGPIQGSGRIIRGGNWGSSLQFCRSAYRDSNVLRARSGSIGFRLALSA